MESCSVGGEERFVLPGTQPDLEIERGIEGEDDLTVKLARWLPSGAEIECPPGELSARLASQV
jgi:hypothetical protein